MPGIIFLQPLGIWDMAKRQKTNNNPHGSSDTDMPNPAKPSDDSKGIMLTVATPPNMNIVDISDTISDVEDEEIASDHQADNTNKRQKSRKCKRERRKVKQSKHKLKVPRDSAKDSINDPGDELFHKDAHHKDAHKHQSAQGPSTGNM